MVSRRLIAAFALTVCLLAAGPPVMARAANDKTAHCDFNSILRDYALGLGAYRKKDFERPCLVGGPWPHEGFNRRRVGSPCFSPMDAASPGISSKRPIGRGSRPMAWIFGPGRLPASSTSG